ncbi:YfdX family protein [Oceaniradius stylonematis]|uniref:YfdX family protein n=1 Tax=Oceaniradius stylonematis TaxID=2184161 RepID=UPI0035CFCAB9
MLTNWDTHKFGFAALLAIGLTLTPSMAQESADAAAESQAQTSAAVADLIEDEATSQVDKRRKELIADADTALKKTEEALTALDEGDTKKALDALAIATGKLELVVARDPDLALAPVDVELIRRDVLGDVGTIRKAREEIEDLIDDGSIQAARPLMRAFASELVVETTHLPLATYPAAIKLATAQIDEDVEAAKQTLRTALSTVVVTEDAIALPVLRAELMLQAAEQALNGEDEAAEASSDGDKAEAAEAIEPVTYVEAARTQLEMAEALGYGTEDDFAELRKDLEELDRQIEVEEDTGGVFRTISENFEALKDRLFGDAS